MNDTRRQRLDRLFARGGLRSFLPAARDHWVPAWRPRGRWWMRDPRRQFGGLAFAPDRSARRLVRPTRAA